MKTLLAAILLVPLCVPASPSCAQTPPVIGASPSSFNAAAFDVAGFGAIVSNRTPPDPSARELTLDEAERAALEENPEIHVAVRRVAMAEAHVPAAGALDDSQFMFRGWQIPLKHPWDYNSAQNMLMVSQALPGPGKRGLETGIAQTDVQSEKDSLEVTRLRVRVEVRKAFYDLLLAQDELQIHDQHVAIAHQAIEAARIKYTTGKVPQQDMLKAQLALTRLAEHMIRFDRDADVARAHRVASKLVFGMVWINDHHRLDPASPWGGFKNSGLGREEGIDELMSYTEVKTVHVMLGDGPVRD